MDNFDNTIDSLERFKDKSLFYPVYGKIIYLLKNNI